jgi:RHS repeat-associated protein
VGTGTASTGTSSGWALLSATGTSTSSGTLLITLSSSVHGVAFDDLTLSEVNVSSPTLTWAQQFGYDGFGNLLSQTVTAGSAPSMSLSVNTSTNRVTNSGVTYDAAGNLTSNGTASYSYDELNRLISTGLMSYGYNGDNKRVVAYYGQSYPQFTMNLYGPSGQRLSSFTYQNNASNGSGGWGTPLTSNAVNYLYLGSKPLNYSDDTVGSNASAAQYYPYGQVLSGSTPNETQAFGTYVQDESGLLYSDQRYMYQNWGRFLTPDPSDKNIRFADPTSWNRYLYVNGDPANGRDPKGLEDDDLGGSDDSGGGDDPGLPGDGQSGGGGGDDGSSGGANCAAGGPGLVCGVIGTSTVTTTALGNPPTDIPTYDPSDPTFYTGDFEFDPPPLQQRPGPPPPIPTWWLIPLTYLVLPPGNPACNDECEWLLWRQSQGNGNWPPLSERCRQVKNQCISRCTDLTIPTKDHGSSFYRCVNECMSDAGCTGAGSDQ